MTATTSDTRPPVAPDGGKPTRGAVPTVATGGARSRRRPWLMVAGGILAILGALGALWLVSSAGDRVSVVALARDVPYGAVMTEADLQVVNVSIDPALDVVPADRLLGRRRGGRHGRADVRGAAHQRGSGSRRTSDRWRGHGRGCRPVRTHADRAPQRR